MYCSSCGAAAAQGVSFCNLCGAKLGGARADGAADASALSPDGLVWAVVTVFVVGLGAYFYRPLAVVTPATGR